MSKCSECTYLNPDKVYNDGTFWCDLRLECVFANQMECYRFCRAYSRPSSVARSYEEFSISKTNSTGCYLTTMLCQILKLPDNNPFLNNMRDFRNNVLQKDKKYSNILAEYDIIGPIIANNLNNDPLKYQISANAFFKYIKPINALIKNNNVEEAILLYTDMTNTLRSFYSIDTTLSIEDINNIDFKKAGHGYMIKNTFKCFFVIKILILINLL